MTIERAKETCKAQLDGLMNNPQVILDPEYIVAEKMAIKSLEAWEKVKAEIDESRDALKTMTEGEWFAGKLKGLDCAVAIIDKHLQEVEHD